MPSSSVDALDLVEARSRRPAGAEVEVGRLRRRDDRRRQRGELGGGAAVEEAAERLGRCAADRGRRRLALGVRVVRRGRSRGSWRRRGRPRTTLAVVVARRASSSCSSTSSLRVPAQAMSLMRSLPWIVESPSSMLVEAVDELAGQHRRAGLGDVELDDAHVAVEVRLLLAGAAGRARRSAADAVAARRRSPLAAGVRRAVVARVERVLHHRVELGAVGRDREALHAAVELARA